MPSIQQVRRYFLARLDQAAGWLLNRPEPLGPGLMFRLSSWLFNLRDLEPGSRDYYLKEDSALASISIGAAVLLVPPMAYLDYFYYQLGREFFLSVVLELLFAVFSIGIALRIRRTTQVKAHETLILTWGLAASLFAFVSMVLQPTRIVENCLFALLLYIANFITLQNRLLFLMVPAAIILMGLGTALLTNRVWFAFSEKYMFSLLYGMLSLFGLMIVASNNRFRRMTFALQKSEREARLLCQGLAQSDSLTGLANWSIFYKMAEQEWALFKRGAAAFSVAIRDLNRFKLINDTYGPAVGDEALRQFASLVARQTRATDVSARVGGEEFGFLFRDTLQADALMAMARLRETLQTRKVHYPELEFSLTFSAGIAEARPDDQSLRDTIKWADQALYRAKELGRDRIEPG